MMKRITIAFVLLLGVSTLAQAQSYKNLNYPKLDNVDQPDVTTFKADNGVKFFLVEDHELPLVNMQVLLRAGGEMVSNNKTGLASMTGTVMRSGGTETIPGDSLNALLENKAARMETGIGFSSGSASMNVLKENFDELLPVFVKLLTNPAFPKDKIELAKKQNKSAISRRNDNIDQIGRRVFDNIIYGKDSKYARHTEYETINNITREDMVKFHNQNFKGKNMMVGIVGDFDTGRMKKKLQKAFGDIPAGSANSLDFPDVNYKYNHTINYVSKPDVNQSLVLMGHIGGLRDNPDYPQVQVMNQVLSGGFSGRLMQQIRTNLGLAYGVGGRYGMNSFYPGQFVIQTKTKSGTTAEAIDAIIKEVKKMQQTKITKKELSDAKDQILNSSVFHHDSYSKILNDRLYNDYRGLPKDSYQQYLKGVQNTSIEDVQKMAQKYMHPDKMQILVVGNKKEIGDQLQKYGNVNTIDISIPQPGDNASQKEMKGDAKKGKQLFGKMADAIIAPGTEVNSLSLSGKVKLFANNRTLNTTMRIDYPGDIEQSIKTGRGTIKLMYKDGKGKMMMAGQERPLPSGSQQIKSLKNSINRSVVTIAKQAGDLNPQFLGTETKDGTTYNKVSAKVKGKNMTFYLNQDTNLPDMMEYKQFVPQLGKQVEIVNKYSNWTSKDGVTYPYDQLSLQDGEKQAKATYNSHKVNADK